MAQVLKDTQRNKIIEAAKVEFLEKGIPASSMRAIAKRADMAVGNLYHYFKNKQEIVKTVVEPVLCKLQAVTQMFAQDNQASTMTSEDFIMNEETVRYILTLLSDKIVEVSETHTAELLILINDDEINEIYENWVYMLISFYINKSSLANEFTQTEIITRMVSKSIFSGMKTGIMLKCQKNVNPEEFRKSLSLFLLRILDSLK